jgi:hypothetical protein
VGEPQAPKTGISGSHRHRRGNRRRQPKGLDPFDKGSGSETTTTALRDQGGLLVGSFELVDRFGHQEGASASEGVA